MNGTSSEQAASDQRMPLVRNSLNWMYAPPRATIAAKSMGPARESGVVLGSEIMKNVNSSSAPFSSRCRGMVIGSPSHSDRPMRSAHQAAMNAYVTSLRAARFTTSPPRQALREAQNARVPHWPGGTQTRGAERTQAPSG